MSRKSLLAISALVLVTISANYVIYTEAQRFAPGYCPTVAAHENFDKTKFFGNWIEVEKTPSIFDLGMRCLVVDYSDDQDNTVNVVVRGVSIAGLPVTINGDGLLQDVHRSGFYSIRYGFGIPFQGTLTTIIDTDYDDYAVVYSCTNSLLSGVFHNEYIWVLSRSGKISNPTRQNIYEKLDKLSINRSGLTMSDRSTCPTNSTTIARESDKDLVGQLLSQGSQNSASLQSNSASQLSGSGSQSSSSSSGSSGSGLEKSGVDGQKVVNLEKINPEPTQKSVIVPLLYDLPSPASSSSVGGSSKQNSLKNLPSPVDNKVQQLPLSSVLGNQLKQAAAASQSASGSQVVANKQGVSQQQQSSSVVQQSPASSSNVADKQQSKQQSQVVPQQQLASPVQQSSQQQKQEQQPNGLLSKIQQKP